MIQVAIHPLPERRFQSLVKALRSQVHIHRPAHTACINAHKCVGSGKCRLL